MKQDAGAGEAPLPGGERGWGEGGVRHRAPAAHTPRARILRSSQTDAERRLWAAVRAGRFGGFKFRRQVPIGRYIVDFLCPAARLVIELDGSQQGDQAGYDRARTEFLEGQGYRVMRFSNHDALSRTDDVLATIFGVLSGDHPLPNPSPLQGEGL